MKSQLPKGDENRVVARIKWINMGRAPVRTGLGSLHSVIPSVIAINYNYSISPLEKQRLRGGGSGLLHRIPGLVREFGRGLGNICRELQRLQRLPRLCQRCVGGLTHSSEERSCCPEDKSHQLDQEHGATVWLQGTNILWLMRKPRPAVSPIQKYLVPEQTSLHGR